MDGICVSVEGPEGAGKTSLITAVTARLEGLGYRTLATRELGGSPYSQVMRQIAIEQFDEITITTKRNGVEKTITINGFTPENDPDAHELSLHFAGPRANVVRTTILPALAAGKIVLVDRLIDTPIAVQGYGDRLPLDKLRGLLDYTHDGFKPDLTLLLDLPVPYMAERFARSGKGGDRYESKGNDFFERVRQGYLAQASANPDRIAVLDATRPPEDVLQNAIKLITARLATRQL